MAQPGRSIFEEVGQDTPTRQTAQTGMIERGGGRGARRGIRAWLIALFALITVMVLVGGMTRLTDSGLSITEWNLVGGSLPRRAPKSGPRNSRNTSNLRSIG